MPVTFESKAKKNLVPFSTETAQLITEGVDLRKHIRCLFKRATGKTTTMKDFLLKEKNGFSKVELRVLLGLLVRYMPH